MMINEKLEKNSIIHFYDFAEESLPLNINGVFSNTSSEDKSTETDLLGEVHPTK